MCVGVNAEVEGVVEWVKWIGVVVACKCKLYTKNEPGGRMIVLGAMGVLRVGQQRDVLRLNACYSFGLRGRVVGVGGNDDDVDRGHATPIDKYLSLWNAPIHLLSTTTGHPSQHPHRYTSYSLHLHQTSNIKHQTCPPKPTPSPSLEKPSVP